MSVVDTDLGKIVTRVRFPMPALVKGKEMSEISKRPKDTDFHALAEELYPQVKDWLMGGGPFNEAEEKEYVLDQLADALDSSCGLDGYQIARHLDQDHSWDEIDANLVDILDGAAGYQHRAKQKAIKEWVKVNNITCRFNIGDIVSFKVRNFGSDNKETGEITRINAEDATYVIYCEHRGHKREGNGSHGLIINDEDVVELSVPRPRDTEVDQVSDT